MDNFLKEIYNLEEMIKGEINRMCVTYELSELDTMHLHAIRNVEKIWQMNYKRLKEKTFDGIPSAQPEQKVGVWIPIQRAMFSKTVVQVKCSECGNLLDLIGVNCGRGDANYCPNCGARMEEQDANGT